MPDNHHTMLDILITLGVLCFGWLLLTDSELTHSILTYVVAGCVTCVILDVLGFIED